MGVKFSGYFQPYVGDNNSEQIDVQVMDRNGGGELPIRIVDLRMYSESEAREPLATIRPARCELTFLIEDETYESFITDLAQQVEDRYHIILSWNSYQFFVGVVVYEFIEYEDISYPFAFTLNATDGITRLRDIDYLDEDGEPYNESAEGTYLSAMQHLSNAFSKLNLPEIYDQSADVKRVWVHCNWYATNMLNTSDNPLDQVYINSDIFYEEDNDGNIIANSCWEVVEEIMKAFGLSISYGRGIYRIEQFSSRPSSSGFYWNYQVDFITKSGTQSQSWRAPITKDDRAVALPKAGGRFSFLPALRQVKVRYEYSLDAVAVEPDQEYGFGTSFIGGSGTSHKVCYLYPPDHSYLAGQLKPFGEFNILEEYNPLKFRVHYQLMIRLTYAGQAIDYIPFRIVFRIWLGVSHSTAAVTTSTGKTYSRQLGVYGYNNIVPLKEEWLDGGITQTDINIGGYDYVTPPFPNPGSENTSTKYYDIGFETLAYGEPDEPLDVTAIFPKVCVGVVDIISEDGNTIGADYTIEYAISDLTVIYAEANNRAKPTRETVDYVSSVNEGGKDEITINTKIGDRGNTLKVFNGTKLVEPGGWGVGGGGSIELGQLLAEQYHSIRGKPIRLMNRTIIGRENNRIDNLTAFDYCDLFWLALQVEHDFYSQEITGQWWNHTGQFTNPGISKIRKSYSRYNRLDEPAEVPALGVRLQARGRDGSGFTAPTTKFIITDWDLPDKTQYLGATGENALNRILDVFVNGDKLEYKHTIPGSQGNTYFTIDNSDNSIVVSANFPLSARHWIQVYQNG